MAHFLSMMFKNVVILEVQEKRSTQSLKVLKNHNKMKGRELALLQAIAEDAGVDLQPDDYERSPCELLEALADIMGVYYDVRMHERYAIKRLKCHFKFDQNFHHLIPP
jgi:hypothetical protein